MHTGKYYCSISRSIQSHPGDATVGGGGSTFSDAALWCRVRNPVYTAQSCSLFTISVPLYGHHFFLTDRVEHFGSYTGDPYSQQAQMFITRCADLSLLGRYFLIC